MNKPIALGFTDGMTALEELVQRVEAGHHDYAIMLAGGLALSRKTIHLLPPPAEREYTVFNEIDDTLQTLTEAELWTESNIGEALDKRALLDLSGDEPLVAGNTTKYPTIPEDEVILDWFAGATLAYANEPKLNDWDDADVCLAFTDTGTRDTDDGPSPRAQIVLYAETHRDHPNRAISLEIDAADARKLAGRLNRWADEVRDEAMEDEDYDPDPRPNPGSEAFDEARAKVTLDTPCHGCGRAMPDEFDEGRFDGVLNNLLEPFHHGCEDF